jgi:hypothetical protein
VGGTITVGGVTKTITAITSATSLTVDSAFGTFTGQAFTCQTGITQTGTDTLTNASAAPTGFTIRENRGSLMCIFDVGGQDLDIQGTLTVQSWGAQLRNDGTCSNRFTVTGSVNGGELIVSGRKSTANNGPFPYPGFDWLGQNGQKVMQLASTNATYPAKFTVIDACVRFGADWLTTNSGNFSRITTQGTECWILCARGTGTGQARIRQDNTTATIDFQATKTWVGLWLNFGVPQVALKGYTPVDTDGPEINLVNVATATRITLEDYNTTYVVPNYYAGAQIVLLGGAWTRIKNNLLGTNIVWMSSSASGRNVIEFSKQITMKAQDAVGNLLSDGYMYYQPVGSNAAGIRAKGGTADITFDLSQQAIPTVAGSATSEFPYAWGFTTANGNQSVYNYFCTGTTKGAESHVIRSSRYGYDKQSATVILVGNNAATPTFVHASLPTTDKVIANAAAITGVTFNFVTKVMTVTGTLTVQQIYDAYQYQLNQVVNLQTVNECVVTSGQTNYVGWTINNSGTISAGTNLTMLKANVIVDTGTITALFETLVGPSARLTLNNLTASTVYVTTNTGTQYNVRTNQTGSVIEYVAPGTTGTWNWYTERYGFSRVSGTFIPSTGGDFSETIDWLTDGSVSVTSSATVSAYTTLETLDKLYDYAAYMRTQSPKFVLVTRNGTELIFGATKINVDATASQVWSYNDTTDTLTIKATVLAAGAKFTSIKSTGAITFLNAATATCIYVDDEGSSTNVVFSNL